MQCQGINGNGNQCSRITGTPHCWQHQPISEDIDMINDEKNILRFENDILPEIAGFLEYSEIPNLQKYINNNNINLYREKQCAKIYIQNFVQVIDFLSSNRNLDSLQIMENLNNIDIPKNFTSINMQKLKYLSASDLLMYRIINGKSLINLIYLDLHLTSMESRVLGSIVNSIQNLLVLNVRSEKFVENSQDWKCIANLIQLSLRTYSDSSVGLTHFSTCTNLQFLTIDGILGSEEYKNLTLYKNLKYLSVQNLHKTKIQAPILFPENLKYFKLNVIDNDLDINHLEELYDTIIDNNNFNNLEVLILSDLYTLGSVYAKKGKLPKLKYLVIDELDPTIIDDHYLFILSKLKLALPNLLFDYEYMTLRELELEEKYPDRDVNKIPNKEEIITNFLVNTRFNELSDIFNLSAPIIAENGTGYYLESEVRQFDYRKELDSDGYNKIPECFEQAINFPKL